MKNFPSPEKGHGVNGLSLLYLEPRLIIKDTVPFVEFIGAIQNEIYCKQILDMSNFELYS